MNEQSETAPAALSPDAPAVARGVARLFAAHDVMLLSEVPLPNHRRADAMGIDAKGQIVLVEIKVSKSDLLGDHKWPDYLDYCDRFYWAVGPAIDPTLLERDIFLPQRSGLIVADGYAGAMLRPAATHPLAPARRHALTRALARRAMYRLIAPQLGEGHSDEALLF